ncbi:MAG: hypothetical protein U0840_12905 [Gemmataceae bacterium]
MTSAADLSRQTFRLTLGSCTWLFVGLGLALRVPWQDPGSEGGAALVPLGLTVGFLVMQLVHGVRLVAHSGRTWDAATQLICFVGLAGLLAFQMGCYLGMQHFHWTSTPAWWEWLAFPLAHALRGLDLLDVIDATELPLATIWPRSLATLGLVLALQTVVAVFVLSLGFDVVRAWRQGLRWFLETFPPAFHQVFVLPGLFTIGAAMATGMGAWISMQSDLGSQPWPTLGDVAMWTADQVVQVVDLGDVLPLAGYSLSRPPGYWWLTLLAVTVRAGILVGVGWGLQRVGRWGSLRWLGGAGLSADDLEEIYHAHDDPATRRTIFRRLIESDFAVSLRQRPAVALLGLTVVGGLLALTIRPGWNEASLRLASQAITETEGCALERLQRMGSYGAPAAPILGAGLRSVPTERRPDFVRTLAYLGPRAFDPLLEVLEGDDALAVEAATALGRMGLPAIEVLSAQLGQRASAVNAAIREALRGLGPEAVPGLMAQLDRERAPQLVPLLDELEPRWYLRDPLVSAAREVRTARLALALLLEPQLYQPERIYWVRDDPTGLPGMPLDSRRLASQLLDLGPSVEKAVPVLLEHLREERTSSGAAGYLTGLHRLGPRAREAVPELREMLARRPGAEEQIAWTLDGIDPHWRR